MWFDKPGRPETLQSFAEMSTDIDFVLLKTFRDEPNYNFTDIFSYAYFAEHLTPYRLLRKVKPDRVMLANNDGLYAVALNIAAKNKGIPTFAMQHGMIADNIGDVYITPAKRSYGFAAVRRYIRFLFFYLSAFRLKNIKYLFRFLQYAIKIFRKGPMIGTLECPFALRNSDYYICYTYKSGEFFKQRDKIGDESILQIGLPQYDSFFKGLTGLPASVESNDPYYLLIDTSFKEHNKPVTGEQIARCYTELALFCKQQNARLVIKLHPYSYQDPVPEKLPGNIEFVRNLPDAALHKLIHDARSCFSFYSTMTLPVICFKQTYQIAFDGVYYKDLEENGISKNIDFYTFQASDINFSSWQVNKPALDDMIRENLYATDGNSTVRLKNYLLRTGETKQA